MYTLCVLRIYTWAALVWLKYTNLDQIVLVEINEVVLEIMKIFLEDFLDLMAIRELNTLYTKYILCIHSVYCVFTLG